MNDARIRLFVALEIPGQVHAALKEIAGRLRPASGANVRWTAPNSQHLTLKFIGEVPKPLLDAIRGALAGVHAVAPVEAVFRGIGWFPNARRPRVLWAGVEGGPDLAGLSGAIERVLEPLGIARETREFRPHLTLARIKSDEKLEGLRREVERLGAPDFGRATYTEFDLMQSTLDSRGSMYTRLERFSFTAGVPAAGAEAR